LIREEEKFMAIEWKSIKNEFPNCTCGAYHISGHEWYGIGIWENGKGWIKGFIGEWPYGDIGDFIENNSFLNEEVMHWKEIERNYPIYGIKMGEIND
jgi:hypothetical protein